MNALGSGPFTAPDLSVTPGLGQTRKKPLRAVYDTCSKVQQSLIKHLVGALG